MASQTIGPIYAIEDQANTVCKAYSLADGSLVGSSATLSAPGASGIDYFPVFTDLPSAEYRFVLESSAGAALAYGFAAVTLTTATFPVYGQPVANRPVQVSSLTQAALAQFVADDSGQTSAATGSVAKISQGSAGADYSDQLDRIENKTALITGAGISVVAPVTQTGDLNLQIGVDYAEQDALSITVAAGAALRTFLQSEDVTHVWFLAARDRHTNEMKIELDPDGISDVADDGSVTIPISITRDQVPTEKGAYPGGIYVETSTGKFFRRTASNVYVDRSPGKLPTT